MLTLVNDVEHKFFKNVGVYYNYIACMMVYCERGPQPSHPSPGGVLKSPDFGPGWAKISGEESQSRSTSKSFVIIIITSSCDDCTVSESTL